MTVCGCFDDATGLSIPYVSGIRARDSGFEYQHFYNFCFCLNFGIRDSLLGFGIRWDSGFAWDSGFVGIRDSFSNTVKMRGGARRVIKIELLLGNFLIREWSYQARRSAALQP